jgi:hypothetical protein
MRREQIVLPAVVPGTVERPLEWKLPVYHTLHHILTNPVYAGAYVFGRRGARVTIEGGRKRVIRSLRRNWSDWEILIKDHHEGYITCVEFERNHRLIADNANGMSYLGRGSVRRGGALLAGLFRCARCGRKLQLSYGGTTADYTDEMMHAVLDINIPNYASAVVTASQIVASIAAADKMEGAVR